MLTCPAVRDALTDSPNPVDTAVAAHLDHCGDCRAVAVAWRAVDGAVKARPTPSSALLARDAFLARLSPVTPRQPSPSRRQRWVRWAVAASLFLGLVSVTLLISTPREVAAKPKVVEELVEWNLTLAEESSSDARAALARDRLPALRQAVRDADLSAPDRRLADRLIREGVWQTTHDDPLDRAERFHGLAEEILTLAEAAEPTSERSAAFVHLTSQLADRGVLKAVKQAAAKAARDAAREARIERLVAAHERQVAKAAAVAERRAAAEEKQQARKKGKKAK
jgi:hypothetical protein